MAESSTHDEGESGQDLTAEQVFISGINSETEENRWANIRTFIPNSEYTV